jgi:LPS sulfotransferase NodH
MAEHSQSQLDGTQKRDRIPRADAATMSMLQSFLAKDRDLPETPVRMRYLILSQARTGGTFLCEALQRSGHAGMPFEYLNPAAIRLIAKRIGAGNKVALQRLIGELERRRTGANGVFGMQLHVEQLATSIGSPENRKRWIWRNDRIVMLYRRDKLAQAVSLERSFQSSAWHRTAGETGERYPAEWTLEPWIIARHVANLGQQEQIIRAALEGFPGRVFELTYEELDTDFDSVWPRISGFLDIPPMPAADVYPQLVRMRDAASEEMMVRFLAALRDSDLMRDPAFARFAASGKKAP